MAQEARRREVKAFALGLLATGCGGIAVIDETPAPDCPFGPDGGVLATMELEPRWLALDETHAYWLACSNLDGACELARRPLAEEGEVQTLATGLAGASALSLSPGYAYFIAGSPLSLTRVAKSGAFGVETAAPVTIGPTATGWAWERVFFGMNGALASWDEMGLPEVFVEEAYPLALAFGGGEVFWTRCDQGALMKTNGGSPGVVTKLSDGFCPYGGIGVDATDVYWFDSDGVQRTPVDGGGATLVADGATGPLALGDAAVYFAGPDGLYVVRKIGGEKKLLATGDPSAVSVGGECVYWLDRSAGALRVQPK